MDSIKNHRWLECVANNMTRQAKFFGNLLQRIMRFRADSQYHSVGLKLFDLLAQYRQARVQVSDRAFAYAASFFREARERLQDQAEDTALPAPLLDEIDAKIAHSELRDTMAPQLHRRIGDIGREVLAGRYGRYGYGWKSIAQDLFLRS